MAAANKWFLHYWLLFFHFTFCHSADVIYTNQTFKEGDLLVSKGNKFTFGFFSPGSSSNRYLGIWYHGISERSVVWVANRNDPINGSSAVLSINQYGNLFLYSDPDKQVVLWSTNVTDKVTDGCMAQILDSGNLVLVESNDRRIVWQSFDYPTDTFMPEMRFGQSRKSGLEWYFTAWRSADDPATGEYSLKLTPTDSPQMILYKGSSPHWRIHIWPNRNISDIYNYSYVKNQDEIYTFYHVIDPSVVFRIIIDHLGYLKWLTWHQGAAKWKVFFSVPKYPCDFYGLCGAYSICSPGFQPVFECSCLPGYEPKSLHEWYLRDASQGCVRKRLESSSFCSHGEGFVKIENVKFPDTSNAAWVGSNVSRKQCEHECLKNCSCTAYATAEDDQEPGCLAWYGELIDTTYHVGDSLNIYVRVDAVELAQRARKSSFFLKDKERQILMLSVAVAWLAIFFFFYLWFRRKKKRGMKNRLGIYYNNTSVDSKLEEDAHPLDIKLYDISIIVAATNNFSPANKLGCGGFGSVYRGILANGQEIAVKRLAKNSGQGAEEFKNEVSLISKLQHKNLVKLFGCCIHKEEKVLIYEYLPNKSLDFFIFDITRRKLLDWRKRFGIILGIGRGLLYLHQDSRLKVIHRDLKASNILLDSAMNPKISDFGIARIFGEDQMQANTNRIVGTYGYMSPEYAKKGLYSTKTDIFSYGVLILEIICGRKNNDFVDHESLSVNLIDHVSKCVGFMDRRKSTGHCRFGVRRIISRK